MKENFGGKDIAQKLATVTGEIYNGATSLSEQRDVIIKYNNLTGFTGEKKLYFSDDNQIRASWNKLQSLKESVYKYYEYVQFKRARFDCTNVEYDQVTGRIIKMEFEFTGKFE